LKNFFKRLKSKGK